MRARLIGGWNSRSPIGAERVRTYCARVEKFFGFIIEERKRNFNCERLIRVGVK